MPRAIIIGLVLLALASTLLILLVPRWQVLPGPVLADPGFATLVGDGEAAVWQRVGGGRIEALGHGVRLASDDPGAVVGLDQVFQIPAGTHAFRVTATVELRDVVAGPEQVAAAEDPGPRRGPGAQRGAERALPADRSCGQLWA